MAQLDLTLHRNKAYLHKFGNGSCGYGVTLNWLRRNMQIVSKMEIIEGLRRNRYAITS